MAAFNWSSSSSLSSISHFLGNTWKFNTFREWLNRLFPPWSLLAPCCCPPVTSLLSSLSLNCEHNDAVCTQDYCKGNHSNTCMHACLHPCQEGRNTHTQLTHLPPLDVHPVDPLQLAHLDSLVLSVAAGEVPVDASALHDILPSGTGDDGRTDVRSGTGSFRHDALTVL